MNDKKNEGKMSDGQGCLLLLVLAFMHIVVFRGCLAG